MADHKLAVIVPYRDRAQHLVEFTPYLHHYLTQQGLDFEIFIVEQDDNRMFNKGVLFNAGVDLLDDSFDYVVLHDVDLLPITLGDREIDYGYSENPTHLIRHYIEQHSGVNIFCKYVEADKDEYNDVQKYVAKTGLKIHKTVEIPDGFGGIVKMSIEDFKKIDGFSNEFWGWGYEDDDLLVRVRKVGLPWNRDGGGFVMSMPHEKFNNSNESSIRINGQQLSSDKLSDHNTPGLSVVKDFYTHSETKKFKKITRHKVKVRFPNES